MIKGVRWSTETESWHNEPALSQVPSASFEICKQTGQSLVCYCSKRLNVNDWVSVFGPSISATDEPYHCAKLPFPFMLPVYPKRDLYFVLYTEDAKHTVPFILGPKDSTAPVKFKPLTVDKWQDMLALMFQEANDSVGVYGMLQAAFDSYWHTQDSEKEDDFVADDDVATDLLLLKSVSAKLKTGPQAPSLTEEDWNEEETVVDARTGFVVEKSQMSDGQLSEDEDEESIENSSEEEDDEDEDLEEEEDDIPDADAQNVCVDDEE